MPNTDERLRFVKATAYLIDNAITLDPYEAQNSIDDKPAFLKGSTLGSIADLDRNNMFFLSKLFSGDRFYRILLEGYIGIGVEFDATGDYVIVLRGDSRTCKMLFRKLPSIREVCGPDLEIRIREIEKVEFASNGSSYVCYGGNCIEKPSGKGTGILGAWLNTKNNPGIPVGVTNNHVAVECNQYNPGTSIYMPNNRIIGEVENYVPLVPYRGRGTDNLIDFAWIKPKHLNRIDYNLGSCAAPPGGAVELDDNVVKGELFISICNDKPTLTHGNINAILLTFYLGQAPKYKFSDVVEIDVGTSGDSGALILDKDLKIGGIFFATGYSGRKRFGYANKWEHVKSETKIDFDI